MNRIAAIRENRTVAHVAPLLVFLLLLMPIAAIKIENEALPWYTRAPEHWIFPLQTVVCLLLVGFFWKNYEFRPVRGVGFAVAMGLVGIAVWILPACLYAPLGIAGSENEKVWEVFGVVERLEGFDPSEFRDHFPGYLLAVGLRFLRMVVAVALVEEIFWRGFLMRFLVDMDKPFWTIPFGTFGRISVAVTVALFTVQHNPADYLGAVVYGSLACWVAIRTKSLFACVLMHAVANLALGIYVMMTRQWGFW